MPPKFDMIQKALKKTPNRHSGDDVAVAKAFLAKAESSKARGIEFSMPFMSFKNLCKAKKCHFTGLTLTPETFTIDRIDSKKGYVVGNVVACHRDFNNLKSLYENPELSLDLNSVLKGLNKVKKHLSKGE